MSCVHLILLVVPSFILHRLFFLILVYGIKVLLKIASMTQYNHRYFEMYGIAIQTQKFENTLHLSTYFCRALSQYLALWGIAAKHLLMLYISSSRKNG